MHPELVEAWKHDLIFVQDIKREGERRALIVIAIAGAMMIVEILQRLLLRISRTKVVIQVDLRAVGKPLSPNLVEPRFHQAHVHPVIHARAVSSKVGAFRNGVEPGK